MKTRSAPRKQLRQFEHLEDRRLLAGNVTANATTVPGVLLITGDGSSNGILVEQVSAASFKVTGLGTTVNASFSAKTITGVTGGIAINMQGGNDAVTLKNLTV